MWAPVGVLGEVHPEVAERFDLTGRTYLMELDLERLYLAVPQMLLNRAIPRYPAAARDLAIVVGEEAPAAAVAEVIRAAGGPILRDVHVFDVYTGETISAGKKSLAYRLTYQSPERTLTDGEIDEAQSTVVRALGERFGAELRS
jgi:phenylalanyl-tRNA synthetase beta chain